MSFSVDETTHRSLELRANAAPWRRCVELQLTAISPTGELGVALPENIILTTADPGQYLPASLQLTNDQAQTLMDDLWRAGLRPTEGTGSAGALKAVENHLADMRKIAFDVTETNKKLAFPPMYRIETGKIDPSAIENILRK